jgi:hypothetical protein
MLKKVLWIAAACAAVLLALAVSRTLNFTSGEPPAKPVEDAPAAEEAAAPAVATMPAPPPEAAPVPAAPTPDELQVQEDAAATGMTTVEPEEPAATPDEPPT